MNKFNTTSLLFALLSLSTATAAHADDAKRAADPSLGKRAFADCAACHSLKAGENGLGPSLAGVVGREAGKVPGFRYSNVLKRSGVTWDTATLERFLRDPQAFLPGNRMPYSGLPDTPARQALIDYLARPDPAP